MEKFYRRYIFRKETHHSNKQIQRIVSHYYIFQSETEFLATNRAAFRCTHSYI